MAIEHSGFFSVPHLLWHGHPFIMVISEDPWHSHLLPSVCLAVELSLPVLTTKMCRDRGSNSDLSRQMNWSLWISVGVFLKPIYLRGLIACWEEVETGNADLIAMETETDCTLLFFVFETYWKTKDKLTTEALCYTCWCFCVYLQAGLSQMPLKL